MNHIWLRMFPNAFSYMIPLAKFTVASFLETGEPFSESSIYKKILFIWLRLPLFVFGFRCYLRSTSSVNEAVKVCLALSEYVKMAFFEESVVLAHGLPKSVFQSPIFYLQQYVGEVVEICIPNFLYEIAQPGHMKMNTPHIVDLRWVVQFLSARIHQSKL